MKYKHIDYLRDLARRYVVFAHGQSGRESFAICTNLLNLEGVVERSSTLSDAVLVAVDPVSYTMEANSFKAWSSQSDYEFIVLRACAEGNLGELEQAENWCRNVAMQVANRMLIDCHQAQQNKATYYRILPEFQFMSYGRVGSWFAVKCSFIVEETMPITYNPQEWT
jgi:hypothetical protein